MRAPMGRRCQVALVVGTLLVGGCTGVGDLGGDLGDAAPPSTNPTGAPSTGTGPAPGGGAAAPAGPDDEIELRRGQAGVVELDDGSRLSVGAGAILAERARMRLARTGPGAYEPSIDGEWQGRADLRVPLGAPPANSSTFLLVRSGTGWAVQEAEARPDGFLYAGLASLAPVRTLTCPAAVDTGPAQVLSCLATGGVTQLPVSLQAQLGAALGCGGAWPATPLLSRETACATAPPQQGSAPPTSAPPTTGRPVTTVPPGPSGAGSGGGQPKGGAPAPTVPPPLSVALTENPVLCDSSRRPFGVVSGADPGETVSFSAPDIGELRPGEADASGRVTVHWRCDPPDAGRTWALDATGQSSGREVSFAFTGGPPTLAPAGSTPGGLQVSLFAPSFTCDSTRRAAGVLTGAQPGEQVAFSAPGLGPLLPGTADASGRLTVHWRCDRTHAGWSWTLQATGESSGRTGAFSLLGA